MNPQVDELDGYRVILLSNWHIHVMEMSWLFLRLSGSVILMLLDEYRGIPLSRDCLEMLLAARTGIFMYMETHLDESDR